MPTRWLPRSSGTASRTPSSTTRNCVTWDQYAAKAWPTLAVVDPTGYLVASMAGEGHAEGLAG